MTVTPDTLPPVAVIGAGSWGTALAALSSQRQPTLLWARTAEAAAGLACDQENTRYLPGIALPADLRYTADFDQILTHLAQGLHDVPADDVSDEQTPLLILGVPMAGLHDTCRMIAEGLARRGMPRAMVVWTCKGFDAITGRLPHQITQAAFADAPGIVTGVLSGPSFAREVAQGLPVALTIASAHAGLRARVTTALHGPHARVYGTDDVTGVEVGGALKNVMAIACGVADGLSLGTNARAAIITRGLAEMTRLGVALGARADTFAGLTGLGDLVLTATGDLSRNRHVGLELGRGRKLDDILSAMTHVSEGVRCARAAYGLAQRYNIDMPITEAVFRVLFDDMPPAAAVEHLLAREARDEDIHRD